MENNNYIKTRNPFEVLDLFCKIILKWKLQEKYFYRDLVKVVEISVWIRKTN